MQFFKKLPLKCLMASPAFSPHESQARLFSCFEEWDYAVSSPILAKTDILNKISFVQPDKIQLLNICMKIN